MGHDTRDDHRDDEEADNEGPQDREYNADRGADRIRSVRVVSAGRHRDDRAKDRGNCRRVQREENADNDAHQRRQSLDQGQEDPGRIVEALHHGARRLREVRDDDEQRQAGVQEVLRDHGRERRVSIARSVMRQRRTRVAAYRIES